ncbi:MAG TPA: hypothetical protein VJ481_02515 [Patescibacteria group bacterium]|uniref:Uncharacterized protein n=1 Tax=Candidatus Woesebacteria bacterium RBG_13_46_13 TaxID=1802479 RepID=A0A1F7X6I8_9BACT|nr:MAG: hypothetical protein A2Y68_00560 [Candidatus Woesebacteria bacterium RBG_13_46_13]HJX59405.1 hypothetical protein [Patescibacteria group bacterium]
MNLPKNKKQRFSLFAITLFLGILVITATFIVLKILTPKENFVYAKVKVAQGLWWASTQKPAFWFAKAISRGDSEHDLLGRTIAQVTDVRYYPDIEDKYNIYLTLKLASSGKGGKYSFKNSPLSVGSPIELELNRSLVTGTVIDMNENPFEEKYVDKKVLLRKIPAYRWEYNAINIGDEFSDGKEVVFKVISKNVLGYSNISKTLGEDRYLVLPTGSTLEISVLASIKLKYADGFYFFGEEKAVRPGATFSVSTPNFDFRDFEVVSLE